MAFISRRKFMIGGAVSVIGAGALYKAIAPKQFEAEFIFKENGLAIRGTDPVAYFLEHKFIAGSDTYTSDWKGAKWRFASAKNRDLFTAAPDSYAPQYGGFCAWAVAAKGKLYSTQPKNWSIVGGKLYLNYNDNIQTRWEKDIDGFIRKGDQRWPEVLAKMA
ncbi:YHS domain protein [Amylibacter sp. SFDW26]|uniref:YHS domain-containing (seleno)protein n=1 Tax=Amylibacter sp. SFDW26 TaxID=2652722 RepID=UPI0012626AB2|nr:YHS domain-containing (seleno)protein [Amylibacter sp. SFDW26]KAB7615271.1 YHS domain protein [Amylibacter sp. SFDW26]